MVTMRLRNRYVPVVKPGRYVHCRPAWQDLTHFGHLKLQLEGVIEPLLTEAVHGWRPGHGVPTAIHRIASMKGTLIGLDIVEYFPNIDQDRLAGLVQRQIPGGDRLWPRIQACLPEAGLPDGAAFAPLLANLYLTPLDARFPTLTRYGDNIVVVVERRSEVDLTMRRLRMSLNEIGLATHERQKGGVVFCKQILLSLPDGRIVHKGRRCEQGSPIG
jgi:RNA-directed DNA polymerase